MLDETLLRSAEENGTFDLESLEKTLVDIRTTSYNFLRQAQVELVGHDRFNFKASELVQSNTLHKTPREYPRKYVKFVESAFISEKKRRAYKRSEFYNKEITIFDISSNSYIFTQNYIVFVDGRFIDGVSVFPMEDRTGIVFTIQDTGNDTGIPESFFKEMVEKDMDVTVFFIPNCSYGIYNTNRYALEMYKDNLSLSRFNIAGSLDTEDKYITFINTNDLLFTSVITDTVHSGDMLRFGDNTINNFTNRYAHLNIFGFRNLLDQVDIRQQKTFERLPTPATIPTGLGNGCKWSPFGKYVAIVHDTSPFVTVYENTDTGLIKISDPDVLPSGHGRGASWTPDGTILSVAHYNAPYITNYEVIEGKLRKMDNPDVIPSGTGLDCDWSPDGKYLAVGHQDGGRITVYRRNGRQLEKVPFTHNVNGLGLGVEWSPDGKYLALTGSGSKSLVIFQQNDETFTPVTLNTLPEGYGYNSCDWSPDGKYLAVAHSSSPFISIYSQDNGVFTEIESITIQGTEGRDVCWSPDGKYLAVATLTAPFISMYDVSNGVFTRMENAPSANSNALGCDWSPDGSRLVVSTTSSPRISVYSTPNTVNMFKLPRMNMPIPAENIMIFRNVNGSKTFAHDITIKSYYPYYYEIIGNDNLDDLTIYPFYFNDRKVGNQSRYKNDLETIMRFMEFDRMMKFMGNPQLKGYQPEEHMYDIPDFKSSTEYDNHLAYKINKLKSWIAEDGDLLRVYLKHQYQKNTGYYIDCSKIDLVSKYRENNHSEVEYESEKKVFDEPHYLFVLRNDYSEPFRYYRFFIDGELFVPDITYRDGRYEYFYIPVRLVNTTTVIDIEKFDTYSFEKNIKFSAVNVKQQITFNSPIPMNSNDIFVVNAATNQFIPRASFKWSIISNGIEIDLSYGSFKDINGVFNISLVDTSLINVPLRLHIRERFYFEKKEVKSLDDGIDNVSFTFEVISNNDPNFIRVFKNGRLVPNANVYINFQDRLGGKNIITPAFKKHLGDVFVADFTPYKYRTVYSLNTLPTNGYLDLNGKITRPFDLKWYDVYLNGRRLNLNNIDILSPTKIYIKNVSSLKHFQIIEKNRDEEYFGLVKDSGFTATDDFWQYIKPELDAAHPPTLPDTEPDIITEIIDMSDAEIGQFFEDIITDIGFINPDINQISQEVYDRYKFLQGKPIVWLNGDDNPDAETTLYIHPKVD